MESSFEKKNILRNQTYCRKGCMQNKPHPYQCQHASAGPRPARGRIFGCILVTFRRHFGQCWALLAPFWSLLGPFGSIFIPFRSLLAPFWRLLAQFCIKFIKFGIDLRRCVFSRIISSQIAKTTNPQATERQTQKLARRNARSRFEL